MVAYRFMSLECTFVVRTFCYLYFVFDTRELYQAVKNACQSQCHSARQRSLGTSESARRRHDLRPAADVLKN